MTPLTLPPGLTEKDFNDALAEFRRIVGDQYVFTGDALSAYRDPYSIEDDSKFSTPAAVAPDTAEQVQAVVKVANQYGVPLWTISAGKNHGYGGAAPRMAGTVVLDLARMNRILEINVDSGYALLEPGVTYFDLYRYIQEKGLKLWLDVPDPGWGSVVGNALERGIGYTPYGDHFMMQCGMEVVLANGEVMRTGMGAMPKSNAWQLFKYGYGPYADGIFTQSNYGIVTKMGIWLMPEPPGYRPYMISFQREEDLEQVIDVLRPLKVNNIIQNAATLRSLLLVAGINATRSQYHSGPGPIPDSAAKKIMADQDIGMWNFYGALYGPPPLMDVLWGITRDAFASIPGARFFTPEERRHDNDVLKHRALTMRGVPRLTEYSFVNWVGGGGHIGFSPVSPINGKEAMQQYIMVRDRLAQYGFDYLSVFAIGWRELHHVIELIFDRRDPEEKRKAYEVFGIMVREAAEAGYGEYRTHISFMDQVAKTYSWNDHAQLKFQQTLKDALDPKGILSPGKQGIWPARYRQGG
ncbi:MAG: FAD-binding oxidoreductase [Proteobacteria bacterium]|jgi:4-cresol dehydrogenase (hydroxylating)|nr:FAD-binding oxidoreductase [Pseudomonadota bacterium]